MERPKTAAQERSKTVQEQRPKTAQERPKTAQRFLAIKSDTDSLQARGYELGTKIGKGSFATVITATFLDRSNKKNLLACKIVDRKKATQNFQEKFFPRELEIIKRVNHPNIIQIHSVIERETRVFIFMKYAENGDLLDYIKLHGAIKEETSREWFHQMVKGLQYLHLMNIAHRDLKCENILITKRKNIKLADFGFAKLNTNPIDLSKTFCGSSAYAAPEIIMGEPYNPFLADIWSLGVVLFIMINAKMPFKDKNVKHLLNDQREKNFKFRSEIINIVSNECKKMTNRLLEFEPKKRITLSEILSSSWIKINEPRNVSK